MKKVLFQFFLFFSFMSFAHSGTYEVLGPAPSTWTDAEWIFGKPFAPFLPNEKSKEDYEEAVLEAFYDLKDFRRLKQLVDEGIRLYPESPRLWTFRAKYYFFNVSEPEPDRNHLALSAARKALDLDPENPKNYVNIGWIYQDGFKDYASAIRYYEKGEAYAVWQPRLHFYMAKCYEAIGNLEKASSHFKRFLQILPECQLAPEARMRLERMIGQK